MHAVWNNKQTVAAAVAAAVAAVFGGQALFADAIVLGTSARVAPGEPATVADVATLQGENADALGAVVVVATESLAGGAWVEVTPGAVRRAIDAAHEDGTLQREPNWGQIELRGRRCAVRVQAETPRDDQRETDPKETMVPVDALEPKALRAAIAVRVAARLDAEPGDVRVAFDERDAAFLDGRVGNRKLELRFDVARRSAQQRAWVRLYDGDRLVERRDVSMNVEVRTETVEVVVPVGRGERLQKGNLRQQSVWLAPAQAAAAGAVTVQVAVGKAARRRIPAGRPLGGDDIQTPRNVRRGQLVRVRCISGGVSLEVRARAMEDGREGDSIELRIQDAEESFLAVVQGPGEAVVHLGKGATR